MSFFNKKIIFIRVPKIISKSTKFSSDVWSHIYGFFSAVGLGITILFTYYSYKNTNNDDIKVVIQTLSVTLFTLMVTFIIVSAYYARKISKNKQYKSDYLLLENKLKNQYLTNKYQSECFHNITHYYRNSIAKLYLTKVEIENLAKEEKLEIIRRMDYFFVILTSSLQNYFSFVTEDNCSVTIKLIKDDKKHFNTFFRDPINFNKRRKVYPVKDLQLISENTALKMIVNPNLQNICFYDDNLNELYKKHEYTNTNQNWHQSYNATLVVPISMVTGKDERNILGFLCVDNFKGKLSTELNKEFLFGISDLLYNFFKKYKTFIDISYEEIKENGRVKNFNLGN